MCRPGLPRWLVNKPSNLRQGPKPEGRNSFPVLPSSVLAPGNGGTRQPAAAAHVSQQRPLIAVCSGS